MIDFDVIIVGGGPAGSTAARRASLAGLNVLLLDRENFPRYKSCAGAIRHNVIELLDFDLKEVLHREISAFSIFSPSGMRADCFMEDRSRPGFTVMRSEFDHLLVKKAAEAGTEIKEGIKIIQATQNHDRVSVITDTNESLTARYLIGADGINSIVAKSLGFYNRWQSDKASIAIEIDIEVGSEKVREICGEPRVDDTDIFFLYFGDLPHGYTWCFPKRTMLSLGACCRQDKADNLRNAYRSWYARFNKEHNLGEPRIVSDTAARFPLVPANTIVKGRTILAGDAAGFVDAFTGEGIPHAIQSGIIAASVVEDAIKYSNPHRLKMYKSQCKKMIIKDLKNSISMANKFYKSRKNMETLTRFFSEDSHASYLLAALIGGAIPSKVAMRKITMRMMRTRPGDALSLIM